ncbi:hypothetical protein WA026_007126 [Henosepilachna vigintioctopunctata]|uniref:Uncharacterized protein n=1 Tax=Henosepilachna vigintioctopunctata TaxID=420089 RepID=A0AAW1V399_9CUCU
MAVWYGYQALYSHFKKAQGDKNKATTELAMYDKLVRRSIAFFECLKEKPGTKNFEAKRAAITGNFCDVPLTRSTKIIAINDQQLLSSVINNLKRRLFTTRSTNEPSTATGTNNYEKEYESLFSELKVLESNNWPPEYVGYGEQEIEHLCARIRLNANKIKKSFRDYLEN